MKNLKTILVALTVVVSGLFNANAQSKKIDIAKSSINWTGKKVTGKHNGTVNFKDGSLVFKKSKLIGGEFNVDMTSLTATDLTGEYQGKLNGHLKSEDFFGTEKYPLSTLVIKKITSKAKNTYNVIADLTIKGNTNPIVFDLTVKSNTAITKFKVDRTKYNIKYGSGSFFDNLGDKAISDDFELEVKLVF